MIATPAEVVDFALTRFEELRELRSRLKYLEREIELERKLEQILSEALAIREQLGKCREKRA